MPLREDFRLPVRHGYAVCAAHGVWRSLVARFVRDEEVVSSNPATPTIMFLPQAGPLAAVLGFFIGAFLLLFVAVVYD